MQIIPEWAPNIHPLIIHFPIAILILAVLANFLSLVLRKFEWLIKVTVSLYVIGTLSALAAFFTGRAAADSLDLPTKVINTLTAHADWAEYTVWYFGVFTAAYITFMFLEKKILNRFSNIIKPILFLFGFGGLFLVYLTADAGAKMVYGYGLGTGNLVELPQNVSSEKNIKGKTHEENISTITSFDNGSWKFYPAKGAVETLIDDFSWLEGERSNTGIELISNKKEEYVKIIPNGNSALLTYGNKLKNVQVELMANLDSLDGSFLILHHFIDKNNYDFVSFDQNEISMGRIADNKEEIFEKKTFKTKGWVTVKSIISGKHFRTNINGKLVVHGHGEETNPGVAGFKFFGKGSLLISNFDVQVL